MPRSILIVDTYYSAFLSELGLDSKSTFEYSILHSQLMSQFFGTSNAYSVGLRKCGWIAEEVVANAIALQDRWATENRFRHLWKLDAVPPSYLSRISFLGPLWEALPSLYRILKLQIRAFKPDVVYFQDLNVASGHLLDALRKAHVLVVGQIASPLPPKARLRKFDLILSSLPNQVEQINSVGVRSEHLPIAFDPRVINELPRNVERDIPVSFVGGISKNHGTTIPLLQAVAERTPDLQIFGYGADHLDGNNHLQILHGGTKWGLEMYKVLLRSQVTLNRHISVSGSYANNMRLYESTGMGSLLITDAKSNLSEIFRVGSEILAYANFDEAGEMVKWALNNPADARKIAEEGQRRTLQNYTYDKCMQVLDSILRRYL